VAGVLLAARERLEQRHELLAVPGTELNERRERWQARVIWRACRLTNACSSRVTWYHGSRQIASKSVDPSSS